MAQSNLVGKGYLIAKVAKDTGIEPATLSFVYDTLFSHMLRSIEKGSSVILPGIGRIGLTESRSFVSNMTKVMIPKHKRIKFWANARLARKIRVDTRE